MKTTPLILLFCSSFFISLYSQDIKYNGRTGIFTIPYLKPPVLKGSSSKNEPFWGVLIEFGDGNYKIDSLNRNQKTLIRHYYKKVDTYKVRLFLTPHYATDPTRDLETIVKVGPEHIFPEQPPVDDIPPSQNVTIINDANNEAVPNHEIRVVLPHRRIAESYQSDVLIFLFNHKKNIKKLGFKPFKYQEKEDGLYYQRNLERVTYSDINPPKIWEFVNQIQEEDSRKDAKKIVRQYEDYLLFRARNLNKNEIRRTFLSLKVNAELDSNRYQTKELQIAALWLPGGKIFSKDHHLEAIDLRVEQCHDPNKHRLNDYKLFYKKGTSQLIRDEITFKNTFGLVKHVDLHLFFENEFDLDSIEILADQCEPAGFRYIPFNDSINQSNLKIVTKRRSSRNNRELIVRFRNINLARNEEGKLKFTLQTKAKDRAPRASKIKGYINFIGSGEEIQLKSANIKWREHAFTFSGGYNFLQKMKGFQKPDSLGFYKNFSGELSYLNRPFGKGYSWGVGIEYAYFEFERTILSNDKPMTLALKEDQIVNLHNLALKIYGGYHLNNRLSLHAFAGISIPVFAKVTLDSEEQADGPVIRDTISSNFGYFQERPSLKNYLGPTKEIFKATPGLMGGIALEAQILPNILSARASYQFNSYSRFYHGDTALISHFQLSFRMKLFAF